jgi:hypothetical protein
MDPISDDRMLPDGSVVLFVKLGEACYGPAQVH